MAEKPEDLNLPTAVITRMVKEVLPENVNISKEARAAISKSASVFVLYATSCANNIAQKKSRKTLTANDVFVALDEMEFPSFLEPLKESLEAFKVEQKGKKDAAELKKKRKAESAANKENSSEKSKKMTAEKPAGDSPEKDMEKDTENDTSQNDTSQDSEKTSNEKDVVVEDA